MSSYNDQLDREVSIKAIVYFLVGLTVVVVVSCAALWGASLLLRDYEQAQDPPPPLLEEARQPYEPPAPRLQTHPFADMDALRAHEDELLATYDWVDEQAGTVRVPIDVAIERVASGEWQLTAADAQAADAPTADPRGATETDDRGGAVE